MSWTAESAWKLARDVMLTLTGLVLIVLQSLSSHPNDSVIVAGLALTGIGATFHVGSLMSGRFGLPASRQQERDSPRGPGRHSDDGHGADTLDD